MCSCSWNFWLGSNKKVSAFVQNRVKMPSWSGLESGTRRRLVLLPILGRGHLLWREKQQLSQRHRRRDTFQTSHRWIFHLFINEILLPLPWCFFFKYTEQLRSILVFEQCVNIYFYYYFKRRNLDISLKQQFAKFSAKSSSAFCFKRGNHLELFKLNQKNVTLKHFLCPITFSVLSMFDETLY